ELVVGGDALGDRDDQRDSRILGLEDRVRGKARRHEDHRRVGARPVDRLVERVEHGDSVDVPATLARRDAAHDLRAVVTVPERMECPLATRDAGHAKLGLGVDEDAHPTEPATATTFSAAPSIVASVCTFGSFASASNSRPSLSFVPSSRTTNGTLGLIWLN